MSAPKKPDESELGRRLDVARRLPSLARVSLVAASLTVVVFFAWPLAGGSGKARLSPGAVSNHHRQIEAKCESCHGATFRGPSDERCSSCHAPRAHPAATTAACTVCHREHHGQRSLVPVESPLCTGCHTKIGSFASHPEFKALAAPRASAALKFSHAKHRTVTVPATLTCASCHVPQADGASMLPVTFDDRCTRCHVIELDERGAGKRVSHGSPQRAYDAVLAGLAQYYVGRTQPRTEELFEREARDLESALYTDGNGCMKCHDVVSEEARPGKSRWAVVPPAIPARWMPAAKFSHARHRTAECISCHTGVDGSVSARDLLLPGIARCRECHADPGVPGKVESPCLECHRYHAKQ